MTTRKLILGMEFVLDHGRELTIDVNLPNLYGLARVQCTLVGSFLTLKDNAVNTFEYEIQRALIECDFKDYLNGITSGNRAVISTLSVAPTHLAKQKWGTK